MDPGRSCTYDGSGRPALRYQPYYCEENVWWLCAEPALAGRARRVAFVSNPGRSVLLAHQRAGGSDGVVVWDYHVVCLVRGAEGWEVWDLDSTLGLPVPAGAYIDLTFPPDVPPVLRPRFRIIDADRYRAGLRTDRSHMRDEAGHFLQPPPPWDPPGGAPSNLMRFVDMDDGFEGEVVDLDTLRRRFG